MYGLDGIVGFTYVNGATSKNYYYRKNLFGDIIAIFDGSGTIYAKYAYDAWGNCTILQDTNGMGTFNPYRYRGYYFDTELNLYYLNARYYDPEIGRFISQDDISYLDPETLNGLNLFAYCLNNPVMGYDPDGTWDWKRFFSAVAIIVAVVAVTAITIATAGTGSLLGAAIIGGTIAAGANALGQVVFDDKNLATLDWTDVGISFVSGAVSSLIPGSGFMSIVGQSAVSSLVENGANALLGRKDFNFGDFIFDTIKGIAVSYALKGISKQINKGLDKIFNKGTNYSSWQHYLRTKGLNCSPDEVRSIMSKAINKVKFLSDFGVKLTQCLLEFATFKL